MQQKILQTENKSLTLIHKHMTTHFSVLVEALQLKEFTQVVIVAMI